MNNQETDKAAKDTKNVRNVWKWILAVGILLSLIAWIGGFFNHDRNAGEADRPGSSSTVVDTTNASDTTMKVEPDTIMEHVRGTK